MVRCKFVLAEITESSWSKTSRTLKFSPQYDTSIPDDARFAKASPNGSFVIQVDNPSALAYFKIGQAYYFDATECPAVSG